MSAFQQVHDDNRQRIAGNTASPWAQTQMMRNYMAQRSPAALPLAKYLLEQKMGRTLPSAGAAAVAPSPAEVQQQQRAAAAAQAVAKEKQGDHCHICHCLSPP